MAAPTPPPFDPHNPPDYIERTHHIQAVERERYLRERRRKNGLELPTDDNLIGLAISGGGVRSATLGLGLFQAFIRANVLKCFDYLSTVSGGGYIGSCLSSLLSREPNNLEKYSPAPNANERYKAEEVGLSEDDCPLSPKIDYEYAPLERTRLTAKHQLLHLRRYGEYLTPRRGIFGWDVSRAVGAVVSGLLIHLALFLLLLSVVVLVHHVLFAAMSGGRFIEQLAHPLTFYSQHHPAEEQGLGVLFRSGKDWDALPFGEKLSIWFSTHLWPQIYLIVHAVGRYWPLVLLFFSLGGASAWGAVLVARRIPERVAQMESAEAQYKDPAKDRYYDRPGGQNLFQHVAGAFERRFILLAYLAGPGLAYLTAIALAQLGYFEDQGYFVMMALPGAFAAGLLVVCVVLTALFFVNNLQEKVAGRLYRSFYMGMQGASFLGLGVALLFPLIILLLFGEHGLLARLLFSFVPVALAYYFTAQSLAGKTGASGLWNNLLNAVQKPLLNLSIFLFVGLALAWVSTTLFELEQIWVGDDTSKRFGVALLMLIGFSALLVLLGFAANSNDISLHFFYRDRLTEAFLRTDGRVQRTSEQPQEGEGQRVHPKGLFDVTLRNHENLRLANLGDGNGKGPYHIIVAALNLQGTEDLAQKTQKSDHFIFSKYFIGSRTTGYYRTDRYRGGSMKLNTAMTISAAAVAGGMGYLGFAASNFYLTLLNLRTGYWIDNPWYLHKEATEERLEASGVPVKRTLRERISRLTRRHPFWLFYLLREMSGALGAKTRRVYVSDGGHTGDNLGLIPLIQRRCRTIVVADFEEDARFSFDSFSQALRLAKAIYNTDIEIDLTPLTPEKPEAGPYCPACVAVGKILYPATRYQPAMEGRLVYLKSSLMKSPEGEVLPVYVRNYARANPAFPHESTADQYFDERQFEAYRMLGEYIGQQAVPHLTLQHQTR